MESLEEGWLISLDGCETEFTTIKEVLPLLRISYFTGAIHAVYLMQAGKGKQLAIDIAGFMAATAE